MPLIGSSNLRSAQLRFSVTERFVDVVQATPRRLTLSNITPVTRDLRRREISDSDDLSELKREMEKKGDYQQVSRGEPVSTFPENLSSDLSSIWFPKWII